jgi:hypothetical protein
VTAPPLDQPFDLVLVANWRPEYGDLMKRLAAFLEGHQIKVGVAGPGWQQRQSEFPPDWVLEGAVVGHSYVEWLRKGKVCIAPVTREVYIDRVRQPGDEDTTRTYELAAAHCFFIHRRTDFVKTIYNEVDEVPMFDGPEELAQKILYYLARPDEILNMAERSHRRAVPAHSVDSRAEKIVSILRNRLVV